MISTLQMAPATLPIPQDIFPPSKAGPAAVEVTRIRSRFPAAISPLVPRSTSTQNPDQIIAEIEAGLAPTHCPYATISDRRQAIARAIAMARPEDTVVVAGKGHEDYQIIGREKIHLDDREEVQKALQTRSQISE